MSLTSRTIITFPDLNQTQAKNSRRKVSLVQRDSQRQDNGIQTTLNSRCLITTQAPLLQVFRAPSVLPQTQLFLSHTFQITRPDLKGDRETSALGNFQPAQRTSASPFAEARLGRLCRALCTHLWCNTDLQWQASPWLSQEDGMPAPGSRATLSFQEASIQNNGFFLDSLSKKTYAQHLYFKKAKKQPQSYTRIESNQVTPQQQGLYGQWPLHGPRMRSELLSTADKAL